MNAMNPSRCCLPSGPATACVDMACHHRVSFGKPSNCVVMPNAAKTAPLRYKALVTLERMGLDMDGRHFALSAGMQTHAEIRLGTRTVMEYLLSPVRKAWHEAGRER